MPETLLQTKLHIPPLRPNLVRRPRLIDRLNQGLQLERKLTLVSAPAGFGKTTLISEWVDTLNCLVAWLSLEPTDDDPGRFFAYIIAALQNIDTNLGHEVASVLRTGQLPPAEIIAITFINDILVLDSRSLLVIDDAHLIEDGFILQVLEQLITNLPQQLHLVLITREDPPLPLARLRANNQLTEIRAQELRFTSRDTELLLHEALELPLSASDVAILENKTEGWVAGLQLAALSIRDTSDPSDLIASLSGSHRFILSYLTEQVLNQQSEEIQQFLLQTAILDRLNGDLCDSVTGRSDSRDMLEQLFNTNSFLIPLDDEGQWYRYHHLFADLLRDRQKVFLIKELAILHRRASGWFAQEGMVGEAVHHALAASDFVVTVELLESHAMDLIMQGYVKTVNGWVEAIPEQWRSRSPKTNLAFAWMHLLRGAYGEAALYLERLERSFLNSQDNQEEKQSLEAEWLVMQALLMIREGKTSESIALAEEALTVAAEQNGRVRSLAYLGLARAYQVLGSDELAMNAYQMSIQYGRAADSSVAEALSVSSLATMALEKGQLHLANEFAAPVSERLDRSGLLPPISAVIYGSLGEVYYQWGQVEQARQYAWRALRLSTLGGYRSGMVSCHVLLSRLSLLDRDLESACREIQEATDSLQVDTPDYVRHEALAQQVRVYLARGRAAAAQMTLQGLGFSFDDRFLFTDLDHAPGFSHALGTLYNSSLQILLYRARARHDPTGLRQGLVLADQLLARADQGNYAIVALEGLLVRAQLHAQLRDDVASQADFHNALKLAEPEGFISLFVEQGPPIAEMLGYLNRQNGLKNVHPDYVERLLEAFHQRQPEVLAGRKPPAPDLPAATPLTTLLDPLTEREMEVLQLMAEGLKYQEIADRLFISLNTVRFHIKTIYGKLKVNNRTQAIETARQLQIL